MILSEFDRQVCLDCFNCTGSKEWTEEVCVWFWRNDFIPACWKDDYLEVVKDL